MSPNRIVALITPVCALAAGWAASWLAENVPGLNVSADSLQAVFIAGSLSVLAPALHWLHGWQKFEARQSDAERLATAADAAVAAPADFEDLELPEDFEDLEDLDLDDELELVLEDAER
jgi:TPP-dependent indolepyruvate ferredoxin oxidoreductase alpha subunit